jgi:hypothetical protein
LGTLRYRQREDVVTGTVEPRSGAGWGRPGVAGGRELQGHISEGLDAGPVGELVVVPEQPARAGRFVHTKYVDDPPRRRSTVTCVIPALNEERNSGCPRASTR